MNKDHNYFSGEAKALERSEEFLSASLMYAKASEACYSHILAMKYRGLQASAERKALEKRIQNYLQKNLDVPEGTV